MKLKSLLILPLLMGSSWLFALDTQIIGPFGGLNNADNSAAIPATNAQDLLNVDLSLGARSVKKREGFGLAYALGITTSPVHGDYDFYDASGNDIALTFNDVYMTVVVNGSSQTVVMSSGTLNATYQCVDSQGFAYCANTSRDKLIKTNGVTFSNQVIITTGTMVAVTPDRLVQSGFGSPAPNRIDFSAAADFTSWTTGVSATSAFQFTITAPGSHITMITYAFNRVMWFKDASFGYILPGATAADWVVKTISPNVGTLDNTYVYYKDVLYFRGQDGHIWSYDGASLQKLSRDIGGTISISGSRISNLWNQSSAADFGAGSSTSTVAVDTTTFPGQVQLATGTPFNQGYCNGTGSAVSFSNNDTRSFTSTFSYILQNIKMDWTDSDIGHTNSLYLELRSANDSSSPYLLDTSNVHTSAEYPFDGSPHTSTFTFSAGIKIISGTRYWIFLKSSNPSTFLIKVGGASSTPIQCETTEFHVNKGTGTFANGYYEYVISGSTYSAGTWQSQVKNAPALTAWDSFNATKLNQDGSHSFFIRGSTGVFLVNSTSPAWTPILPGAIPAISTSVYFQIRDVITTNISTTTPILYDFTQSWFEGGAVDKSYATAFKDAIWWSVVSGTQGVTTNNTILRLDLLNNAWLLYDIASNGFYIRNNALYFGHATTGNVYKYGGTNSDAGVAINSFWKSKDFFADPFTDDDVTDLSVFFKEVDNSTMTVTYQVVGGTFTTYSVPLQRTNAAFGNYNRNMPQGTTGNTFNIKFGNNAADQPWELFVAEFRFNSKSWIPSK